MSFCDYYAGYGEDRGQDSTRADYGGGCVEECCVGAFLHFWGLVFLRGVNGVV
jgi:hypothetical protein